MIYEQCSHINLEVELHLNEDADYTTVGFEDSIGMAENWYELDTNVGLAESSSPAGEGSATCTTSRSRWTFWAID